MATLAHASLSESERRALERFARALEHELGSELGGVWLYGSRARGESIGRESDVDLLVISRGAAERKRLAALLDEAAEAEGADRFAFSLQVFDLDWLAERRSVEAFFVKEVDRDRIVLAGDPDGLPGVRAPAPELEPGELRPRTRELMEDAREALLVAKLALEAGAGTRAVSNAYFAAFEAATAALSEEDRFVRRHRGTWHLFRQTFVFTGRFDAAVYAEAHASLKRRIDADYKPVRFSAGEARRVFEACERFVAAVEAMLAG